MDIKKSTMNFLNQMPEVNSVSAYGSGFFKQNGADPNERKSMDLIISVDNPNQWHADNFAKNRKMYDGASFARLLDNGLDKGFSFPASVGCFFTEFDGNEYKCLVVDKRLLYDDLESWRHFSLAGRFQKETEVLIDNSNGVLSSFMKKNYDGAVLTSKLMLASDVFTVRSFLEALVSLSYMGDVRKILHFENKNKIPNIVEGSYDFLVEHYLDGDYGSEDVIVNDTTVSDVCDLPVSLRNYLYNTLSWKELSDGKAVADKIKLYFRNVDFVNSICLALRCNQTVGKTKTLEVLGGKFSKGFGSGLKSKMRF